MDIYKRLFDQIVLNYDHSLHTALERSGGPLDNVPWQIVVELALLPILPCLNSKGAFLKILYSIC